MANTKKTVASPKSAAPVTPAKEVKKTAAPAPVVKKEEKAAPAAKKEGTSRASATYAGKRIFLNMKNEKVASAEGNNPKRGKCREWFTWYIEGGAKTAKGMAVEDYLKKGGKTGYIRWDVAHDLITLQ